MKYTPSEMVLNESTLGQARLELHEKIDQAYAKGALYVHLTVAVPEGPRHFESSHMTSVVPSLPPEILREINRASIRHLRELQGEAGGPQPPEFLRRAGWHDLIAVGVFIGTALGWALASWKP